MLYGVGLTPAEAIALDLSDYDLASGELSVREKTFSTVSPRAKLIVDEWIELRGKASGPLFYPIADDATWVPHRLTKREVYGILRRLGTVSLRLKLARLRR